MWTTIAAERGALADDLTGLPDDQWATTSTCPRWTVRDVLAHMTSTALMTPRKFLLGFAGSGFRFDRFSAKGIASHLGAAPEDTLQHFRDARDSTTSPPGPRPSWLGETLVHAEDIRRPLGIQHAYPVEAVREVLDFYKTSNALIGTKKRIEGVTLRATDTDWSHGSGPVAEGPLLSLTMVATGRRPQLDDLAGDGVEVLRTR